MGGWRTQAVGVLDFSKGHPPRHIFWNWASLVGTTEDGRSFGLNLTADFNNSLENAVWVNGRRVVLGTALLRDEPAAVLNPWRITTVDGVLDLRFVPDGQRLRVTGSGVTEQHWATW